MKKSLRGLWVSSLRLKELNTELAVSDKLLEAGRVDVESPKEEISRAGMEKVELHKVILGAHKELEQCLLRLNVTLVVLYRAEKLTLSVATKSVQALDKVVKQLSHGAILCFRHGLKRTYSKVCVPCSVALTSVSGVTATSIRRKGDKIRSDDKSGSDKGRAIGGRQVASKTSHSRQSSRCRPLVIL